MQHNENPFISNGDAISSAVLDEMDNEPPLEPLNAEEQALLEQAVEEEQIRLRTEGVQDDDTKLPEDNLGVHPFAKVKPEDILEVKGVDMTKFSLEHRQFLAMFINTMNGETDTVETRTKAAGDLYKRIKKNQREYKSVFGTVVRLKKRTSKRKKK